MSEEEDTDLSPLERSRGMAIAVKIFRVLSVIMVLSVVVIFVLIIRSEQAHDEAVCPYEDQAERSLPGGLVVLEQSRRCMEEAEEHRWMLGRPGKGPVEPGKRRLSPELFAGEGYSWDVKVDEDGGVLLEVQTGGRERRVFREADLIGYEAPAATGPGAAP